VVNGGRRSRGSRRVLEVLSILAFSRTAPQSDLSTQVQTVGELEPPNVRSVKRCKCRIGLSACPGGKMAAVTCRNLGNLRRRDFDPRLRLAGIGIAARSLRALTRTDQVHLVIVVTWEKSQVAQTRRAFGERRPGPPSRSPSETKALSKASGLGGRFHPCHTAL
jgi:hypothetical protein